ncbi:MAG: response regulator [Candidatus Omnitrophota bacterium]
MDKGYSILCIDDEENILQSFNRTLGMEGFKVLLAGSGQEGLDILRKEKIDLILCDQRMPEMSGFEVLRIAKEEYPEVLRIMLSGYSDFESLVKTINEGEIYRFLSKPWDTEELIKVITSALEQKEILCEVRNIFSNVKDMRQLIEDISIETKQDQAAIVVKILSKEDVYNSENIVQFLDYIFKIFGIEKNRKFQIVSNQIFKEKNCVKFELSLAKGVKLIIEIEKKE